MEFEEDRPRISEQGRINDGRRMYRENGDSGEGAASPGASRESRERREPRERREYTPHRQATVSRDPFFDRPYEAAIASELQPAWEAAAKSAPGHGGLSANIKPKKKIAALFKVISQL